MIKVLHIVLGLQVGGLEKFVLDLVSAMDGNVDAKVLCLETADGINGVLRGERIFELKKPPGLRLGIAAAISKIAKREKVDLIHTHNPSPHFYGGLAGIASGIPVIHTKHGRNYPDSARKVWLNRISSLMTDRVVAVSGDSAKVCTAIEKVNAKKVQTILNGIDIEKFIPLPFGYDFLAEFGLSEGVSVIGIVARLSPEKDHATLLHACKILKEKKEEFHLLIIGDGPLREHLETLSAELDLGREVVFTGMRNDIAELLRGLDLFVLTSTTEGISLTLLEAMASGLPVVATRVGGNPEVVVDGETGFLVPAKDPQSLAKRMIDLLHNRALSIDMGKRGRRRVEEQFSIKATSQKYLTLYEEILRERNR